MLGVKIDKARKELKRLNIQDDIERRKQTRPTYQELMEKRAMKPFYMPEEPIPFEVQYEKNVSKRLLESRTRHLSSKFVEKELISKEKLKDKLLDLPKLLPEIDAKYVHTEKKKPKRTCITLGHKSTIISSRDYLNISTKRYMHEPSNETEKKRKSQYSQYPHYRLRTAAKRKSSPESVKLTKSIGVNQTRGIRKNSVSNGGNTEVDEILAPIVRKALSLSENNTKLHEEKPSLEKTKNENQGSSNVLLDTAATSDGSNNTEGSVSSSKPIDTPILPPLVIMSHKILSYPFSKKNPEMKHKGVARNPMGGFYFS